MLLPSFVSPGLSSRKRKALFMDTPTLLPLGALLAHRSKIFHIGVPGPAVNYGKNTRAAFVPSSVR